MLCHTFFAVQCGTQQAAHEFITILMRLYNFDQMNTGDFALSRFWHIFPGAYRSRGLIPVPALLQSESFFPGNAAGLVAEKRGGGGGDARGDAAPPAAAGAGRLKGCDIPVIM